MSQNPRYLNFFLIVAIIGLVFGVLGLLDAGEAPYAGVIFGPDNNLLVVYPEDPASRAGLEVGDVVESIGGISLEDTRAFLRRPRAEIGEMRAWVVKRDGETLSFDLVYGSQPIRARATFLSRTSVGLCFLAFCLWAYSKAPSNATLLLALIGLCFGIFFLPGPYSKSFFLRTVGGSVNTTLLALGFAFLIHFLLVFPKRSRLMHRPWAKSLIYGPAIFLAMFFLYLSLFQPDFTERLRSVTDILIRSFIIGYFGWSVATMIQSYRRATPEERSRHGIFLMLVGTLAALVPVTLSNLVLALAPTVLLPGAQYYALTLALIPITFAMAAVKKHDSAEAAA